MERLPFSVSVCVYGGDNAAHFTAAMQSLFDQTVLPDEIVLVVDGPVPEALERAIARCAENPAVRVHRLPENLGHGGARRAGLSQCKNDLIALMDADDLCVPERFALQLAAFRACSGLAVCGGQIEEFITSPRQIVGKRIVPLKDIEIKQYLKRRCPMNQVTVMLRKSAADAAGGYLDWFCEEDYYLWLRMAQSGAVFGNCPETLVYVRVGEEMYRRRGGLCYFRSEARLQKYMRKNQIISFPLYCVNVLKRLLVQVLLPNRLRGMIFRKFARK